ncbi:helix-hairpin-helix domain-containing protein [Kytococcus sp. Marseille-QA3725]
MDRESDDRLVWAARRGADAEQEAVQGRGVVGVALDAVELPSSVAGARVAPGASAVRALAVLVLVVVLALAGWTWWTGRQSAVHPVAGTAGAGADPAGSPGGDGAGPTGEAPGDGGGPPGSGEAAAPSASAGGAPGSSGPDGSAGPAGTNGAGGPGGPSGAESAAAQEVTVHVVGAVRDPGVVTLPVGGRIGDAVEAAGGMTREADRTALNLARPVTDGEQVVVLRPGEEPPTPAAGGAGAPGSAPGGAAAGGPGGGAGEGASGDGAGGASGDAAAGGAAAGAVVDLNAADQSALEELPGVGPVTAEHILAWREENGQFTSVDELMEVSGIGEKTLETLRPHVTVG